MAGDAVNQASGGLPGEHVRIAVQTADFDSGAEQHRLQQLSKGIGAVASFVGTVRNHNDGDQISTLTLEHYPGMTEKSLADIVQRAAARWPLLAATVIHRVGELRPGDRIVLVAVASAHRDAAFDACRFIMDFLKTEAPFWKKEGTADGERWVDTRDSDDLARATWLRGGETPQDAQRRVANPPES